MKKLLVSLTMVALLSVCFIGSAAAQSVTERDAELLKNIQAKGVLKVGVASTPPRWFQDPKTGDWQGIYYDFWTEFAKDLGVKLEVVGTTWDYIIAGLKAGNYDFAGPMSCTLKRALTVRFSVPTHYGEVYIMRLKKNQKFPNKESYRLAEFDRADVTAVVMSGSVQAEALKRNVEKMKINPLPGTPELWMAVKTGRADIAVGWAPEFDDYVAKNPDSVINWLDPIIMKVGSAFAVRPTVSTADIEALNVFIDAVKLDGRLRGWFLKHSVVPKGYNMDKALYPR